ncbi:MAG: hypothetical protein M0R22_08160 [Dehalococcoidia bacterium]|jgi:hypothetical protein|nr:hypothetical protein [Dehalococcoidia bacterium]
MIAQRTTILKFVDDDPKSLGVGSIVSVASGDGLVEGVDFAVNLTTSTVRRLRTFGRDLLTFVVQYEDHAEEIAAREALLNEANTEGTDAKARILEQIDAALAEYAAALAGWDKLTTAQVKVVVKRLVQVQVQILRYHKRELL